MPGDSRTTARVMIVSASIGGGHDAAADALAERVQQRWPGCRIWRLDTLQVMGAGVGPMMRAAYVFGVRVAPSWYAGFYDALWRHPKPTRLVKRFFGSWVGRRLTLFIEHVEPDLILSSYPLGSAGLAWLRRFRSLPTPVGAWVTDFAPHPFWLYPELDATFLPDRAAAPAAAAAEPGLALRFGRLPVSQRFRPGDRGAARRELGWTYNGRAGSDTDPSVEGHRVPDPFVVLLTGGSYGFGQLDDAVTALLAAGGRIQVVVSCGRNRRLLHQLRSRGLPTERLMPLDWTDDMPTLIRAADVVVVNAGGATAFEALASHRPLVMYRPIAAQGAANARLMGDACLAISCGEPGELTALIAEMSLAGAGAAVRRRSAEGCCQEPDVNASDGDEPDGDEPDGDEPDGDEPDGAEPDGGAHIPGYTRRRLEGAGDFGPDDHDELGHLAATQVTPTTVLPESGGRADRPLGMARSGWPLRAGDAMFRHIESGVLCQQVGAILTVVPGSSAVPLTAASLSEHIRSHSALAPALRRRLVARGRIRQPGWVVVGEASVADHVRECFATDQSDHDRRLDRFWSEPLRMDRPPWEMLILHTTSDEQTTIVFKIHHALADGFSLIESIGRLFDTDHSAAAGRSGDRSSSGRARTAGRNQTPRRPGDRRADWRRRTGKLFRIGRGLAELAWHATAPDAAMNHELTPDRGVLTVSLPTEQIHHAALAQHARSSEVSLTLVAEALHRSGLATDADPGARLRAMLPVAIERPSRPHRLGNRTGAVSAMLPIGPMPMAERLQLIKSDLRRRMEHGEPDAAAFVVRGMGVFPAPVHRWMNRRVYNSRFLNLLTSYIPGPLREWSIDGNRITEIFPVMALANGVTLAVGIMRYGEITGLSLIFDESIRDFMPGLRAAIREGLDRLVIAEAV